MNDEERIAWGWGPRDYAGMARKTEAQLSTEWIRTTHQEYWEKLEVVIPHGHSIMETDTESFACFMVGEPNCDGKEGDIYDVYFMYGKEYFTRPGYDKYYRLETYMMEIREMYFRCPDCGSNRPGIHSIHCKNYKPAKNQE